MDLPFDGAISAFFENDAPEHIRSEIKRADKDDILSDSYPHSEEMSGKKYKREMERLAQAPVSLWFSRDAMPLARAALSDAFAKT